MSNTDLRALLAEAKKWMVANEKHSTVCPTVIMVQWGRCTCGFVNLIGRITAALAEKEGGWIKCSERLPDVNGNYEVVQVMIEGGERSRAFRNFIDGRWPDTAAELMGSCVETTVTHWKYKTPLPAAPTEKG